MLMPVYDANFTFWKAEMNGEEFNDASIRQITLGWFFHFYFKVV